MSPSDLGVFVFTAVALVAEHDDARLADKQCARACGALTRVRRACTHSGRALRLLLRAGQKAGGSARTQREVALWLTSSAASASIDADQSRASPLAAHYEGGRTL